jgi:hypothetical protein
VLSWNIIEGHLVMGIGNGLGRRSPKGVVGNGQLLVDEI